MKKYTSIILSLVLVLGFAASAFAIHAEIPAETQAVVAKGATQITIDGDIRVRGTLYHNIRDFDNNTVNTTSDRTVYEQRVRLGITAAVTPNTTGRILMEAGNSNTNDNMIWGTEGAGATGNVLVGDAKLNEMRILEAWIQHKGQGLMGIPAYFKIGHMPVRVGNGLFYSHTRFGDDAILLGIEPVKGLELTAAYVKAAEGVDSNNDDFNVWSFIAAWNFTKGGKLGLDVTYADGQNVYAGGFGAGSDAHLWNVGLNGKYDGDVWGVSGEIDFQFGSITGRPANLTDQDFRGVQGKADAYYTFKPVKLMLGFGYGSGDDDFSDNKLKTPYNSLESIAHYTFVYEYFTPNAAGFVGGGLQNTWYVKLGAAADLTKELYADLNIYMLRAVKNQVITTQGLTTNGGSKSVGWEVDANIKYKLDRNLTYYVEGGYLFAGKFWDGTKAGYTAGDFKADDAYAVRHGIQLSF